MKLGIIFARSNDRSKNLMFTLKYIIINKNKGTVENFAHTPTAVYKNFHNIDILPDTIPLFYNAIIGLVRKTKHVINTILIK